jgi:hypothetical protein
VALNPDAFIGQTDKQICQTLVHEMHHLWQHTGGEPAPRSYHSKEWAAKMKANGLQPSSTGMVGGKETDGRALEFGQADRGRRPYRGLVCPKHSARNRLRS